jgi:uncharacterized membrane protein YuzA (DUF378 family)
MKGLNLTTLAFVVIGGLNWGLVGFTQIDAIAFAFGGTQAALSRIIYILIGLSAVYQMLPLVQAMVGFRRSDPPRSSRYEGDMSARAR